MTNLILRIINKMIIILIKLHKFTDIIIYKNSKILIKKDNFNKLKLQNKQITKIKNSDN